MCQYVQVQAQVLPGESFQPPNPPFRPIHQKLRLSVHLNNHRRPGTFPVKDQSSKIFFVFEENKGRLRIIKMEI